MAVRATAYVDNGQLDMDSASYASHRPARLCPLAGSSGSSHANFIMVRKNLVSFNRFDEQFHGVFARKTTEENVEKGPSEFGDIKCRSRTVPNTSVRSGMFCDFSVRTFPDAQQQLGGGHLRVTSEEMGRYRTP